MTRRCESCGQFVPNRHLATARYFYDIDHFADFDGWPMRAVLVDDLREALGQRAPRPPRGHRVDGRERRERRRGRAVIDGCPSCVLNTEAPHTWEQVPGAVRCHYECSDCGHTWTTDWKADVCQFPLATWENRGGPSRAVDATRPGPDHLPDVAERG